MQADLQLDDGYGLTEELFVYDAVIQVSPYIYPGAQLHLSTCFINLHVL